MKTFWNSFVVLGVIGLLVSSSAVASCKRCGGWGHDSQYGRLYNPKTEETITGKVINISRISPLDTTEYGLTILIDTGNEDVAVHLGPDWYILSENLKIKENDRIAVRGSKIVFEGQPTMIAAEVIKGSQRMRLRNRDGQPAWSGWDADAQPRY